MIKLFHTPSESILNYLDRHIFAIYLIPRLIIYPTVNYRDVLRCPDHCRLVNTLPREQEGALDHKILCEEAALAFEESRESASELLV